MTPLSSAGSKKGFDEVRVILAEDDTDSILYTAPKFTCHNFAKTLYLQRSSLVGSLENYNIEGIKEEWGNIILRDDNTKKLPIYILTLTSTEHGFYHSINAVLVKPEAPDLIESYIFIEPQTDEIFETPRELIKHYSGYLSNPLFEKSFQMDIGLFTKFIFTGTIYQSWQESVLKYSATL